MTRKLPGLIVILVSLYTNACLALTAEESERVNSIISSQAARVPHEDIEILRNIGPEAVDQILDKYKQGDEQERAKLANVLWQQPAHWPTIKSI